MGKNKLLKLLFFLIILAGLGYFSMRFLKTPQWQEVKNISFQKTEAKKETINQESSIFSIFKKTKEPINFLLLGAAGAGFDAPDLTDTILVARFDEAKDKIFLFSLPRDLLVKIPDSSYFTKINALYAYAKNNKNHEFDLILPKVQEVTGLKINHYLLVDLDSVKKLVDFFGGVNVMVKEDIFDTQFPGPNHSFQTFELKKGWRYLDGETALKYIRSRHSENGDFDRINRQQEILQALKQKFLGLKFWNIGKFYEIYQIVFANLKTDLSLWQMEEYWQKIKDLSAENILKNEIVNQDLFTTSSALLGNEQASVAIPKAGTENYEEIRKYIEEVIK